MAHRLLSGLALAGVGAALVACPHDWAAFDDVPRAPPGAEGGVDAPSGGGEAGAAGGDPAVFATLAEKPTALVADTAGIVFLTLQGSVLTCEHERCAAPAPIASAQNDLRSLAIGYGFVAWVARGDQAVRRAPRFPGRGPAEQARNDDGLLAVALSASKVYFSVDATTAIIDPPAIRYCAAGADCTAARFDDFAEGLVTEILVDGNDAFWLGEASVRGCPLARCESDVANRVVLSPDPVLPHALAATGDEILYGSTLEGGSIRAAPRALLGGGGDAGAVRTVGAGLGAPSRLAVTARSVWFTDPGGVLGRVPRAGGAVEVVAKGLSQPDGIAAAGGFVYVACTGDGRILRYPAD